MINFFRGRRELPFSEYIPIIKTISIYKIEKAKEQDVDEHLCIEDLEEYTSYLASQIFEYQLRLKFELENNGSLSLENNGVLEYLKNFIRKLDELILHTLKPIIYSLLLFAFTLINSVVLAQSERDRAKVVESENMKQYEQQDTVQAKTQNGKDSNVAIANMLQQKKEYKINHDFKKPFAAHGNGVESESVLFQSVLTGYQKGHKSQMIRPIQPFIDGKFSINGGTSYRLGCYNTSLMTLYTEAFLNGKKTFPYNRVILEVNDPMKLTANLVGDAALEWQKKNAYCYELIMPAAVGRSAVYRQMQYDLARMFPQYTASIQQRKIDSYALVRTSKKDKLKTKEGKPGGAWDHFGFSLQNYSGLDYFLQQLEYYLQKELPLINKTGYEGKIDIELKANLSSIEELNKALAAYDLQFVRGFHVMDVLVISDSGREPIEFYSNPADYSGRPRNFDWQPLKKGGL